MIEYYSYSFSMSFLLNIGILISGPLLSLSPFF